MMWQTAALLFGAVLVMGQDVPVDWACKPSWYGAGDGCDCECGAWDPDCDAAQDDSLYCHHKWNSSDSEGLVCSSKVKRCLEIEEPAAPVVWDFNLHTYANGYYLHRTWKFYTTEGYKPDDVLVLRRGEWMVTTAPPNWTGGKPEMSIGGVQLDVQWRWQYYWAGFIPANFSVGRAELRIAGDVRGTVTVLFNPYSSRDKQVYKPNQNLAEYVENENGRYWWGNAYWDFSRAGSSPWAFAQYDVLNYVVELIDLIPEWQRSDARLVARSMTYLLNSASFRRGVIAGRWDGEYDDGKSPTYWTGSRAILQHWSERGQHPVRYGQCWVFACVLTTVLRTLGIPSRPVTNFRSAHESPPYDHYVNESTSDSIWNFHAWVDAALARDDIDLPDVEWNTVDATPQERSGFRYQLGPAPVSVMQAHKNYSGISYDIPFVVSETNAIVLRGSSKIYNDVGRYMSTKRPGCNGAGHRCRQDITKEYKTSNNPFENFGRAAAALGDSTLLTSEEYDTLSGFSLGAESLEVGGDVVFYVKSHAGMKLDGSAGSAEVHFLASAVSYNGVEVGKLDMPMDAVVNPDASTAALRIPEAVYRPYLGRTSTLHLKAEVRTMLGSVLYTVNEKFDLAPPQPEVLVSKTNKIVLKFRNPLAVPLTACSVAYTTPVGDFGEDLPVIAPGMSHTITLTPPKDRSWCNDEHSVKQVVLSFAAAELRGMMHAEADIEC